MTIQMERRYLPVAEARLILVENENPRIVMYPSIFNSISDDLGGFKEIVRPGAFTKILGTNPDVRALVDHISNLIIGRTKAGTAVIRQDEIGLYSEIYPANTSAGRDIVESLRRGDVSGGSIQFSVDPKNSGWIKMDGESLPVREIRANGFSGLFDISVVTFPAFPKTQAELASIEIRSTQDIFNEYLALQELGKEEIRKLDKEILCETERQEILEKEKRDRDIDIFELSI